MVKFEAAVVISFYNMKTTEDFILLNPRRHTYNSDLYLAQLWFNDPKRWSGAFHMESSLTR